MKNHDELINMARELTEKRIQEYDAKRRREAKEKQEAQDSAEVKKFLNEKKKSTKPSKKFIHLRDKMDSINGYLEKTDNNKYLVGLHGGIEFTAINLKEVSLRVNSFVEDYLDDKYLGTSLYDTVHDNPVLI